MLAKVKYLRQEDKALQEIETKLRAQLNRLKQEERVLRRQMREPHGTGLVESDHTSAQNDLEPEQNVDDVEVMNREPLVDLDNEATAILQMCQAQYMEERLDTEEEEEEEEEDEERRDGGMNVSGDRDVLQSDDELGAEYRNLLREMRGDDDGMEEEYDDT